MSDPTPLGRLGDLAATLTRALRTGLARLDFLPPLASRIVIAAIFVPSGWGKLHSLPDVIGFFQSLGIPFPEYQAPFVATVEFVCGLMVLGGLGTRLASFLLANTMVVALITAIWPDVTGVADFFAKDETVYLALLAQLVVVGGGALSLDAVVGRVTGAPATATNRPRTAPMMA